MSATKSNIFRFQTLANLPKKSRNCETVSRKLLTLKFVYIERGFIATFKNPFFIGALYVYIHVAFSAFILFTQFIIYIRRSFFMLKLVVPESPTVQVTKSLENVFPVNF